MKKIKVLLSALAMVAALAFVSCGGGADGTSEPAVTPENTTRTWESISAAPATDNGDGTCSVIAKSQYSGGGMVVYINEDKSTLENGKTVEIEFDYAVVDGKWKDATLFPKFAGTLCKDITSTYPIDDCGKETKYLDGSAASGSLTMTLEVADDKAPNEVFLKFNAYQWKGDETNDEVKITIKKITVK